MKKNVLLLLIFTLLFAVGCKTASIKNDDVDTNEEQAIEQTDKSNRVKNGDMKPPEGGDKRLNFEDLDTTNFSQQQLDMIEKYKNDEITAYDLLSSELFTREELGMGTRGDMIPPKEDLNLDGLSQEQLDAIDKLYDGDITMNEFLESFTASEIENIGLKGARVGGNQKPNSKE